MTSLRGELPGWQPCEWMLWLNEVNDMLVVMTLAAIVVAGLVVMFFAYAIGDGAGS